MNKLLLILTIFAIIKLPNGNIVEGEVKVPFYGAQDRSSWVQIIINDKLYTTSWENVVVIKEVEK